MTTVGSLETTWRRLGRRRVHGIAAVLLPFHADGQVDWQGFERHVVLTRDAGLDCAVNMDTGFGDLLGREQRCAVLDATRRALGDGSRFYAGAYADASPDPEPAYARSITEIEQCGATPVLVQCIAMHGMDAATKAGLYARVAGATAAGAVGFELSPRFAPHGEIWDDETFARIIEIPELLGAKHSSLEREVELARLAVRDRTRPEFRVYTGNDLAIDMVAYGSDYLLGLATFAPDRFAERDRMLAEGDSGFLGLNDGLQHLGNVGFRTPIPAYKHAAAQFLHLCGRLDGDAIHPKAPRRPGSERIALLDCALRLGLVGDREAAYRECVEPYLEDR
ncbi:MAG: dihydrodipicolinate synthase family protein [Deltaproteobacteria bacterium]|nr:dihydrodipicolinate synthase family protein [Deltaproteobacteria bacterium]